jgi:ribosome-associated heat shock protein Hsp15
MPDPSRKEAIGLGGEAQRLDKWLWFARVMKSRTLAAELVVQGKVRVNRVRAGKPSQIVRRGDILTIVVRGKIRVLRVVATGERRGPPSEAEQLYDAIADASPAGEGRVTGHQSGGARPTKRDRRRIDKLKEEES